MRRIAIYLLALGLLTTAPVFAQGVAARVAAATRIPGWRTWRPLTPGSPNVATRTLLPTATFLTVDQAVLGELMRTAPPVLELLLPTEQGELRLKLVASAPLTDAFQVITASTGRPVPVHTGLHYVGIVNDDPHTLAAISLFPDRVMGLVNDGQGDHVLGPLEQGDAHLYYATRELPTTPLACSTPEGTTPYTQDQLLPPTGARSVQCVRFYWEVNNDIFVAKGGLANTVAFATAVFNQSAALYANDGLSVTLNQLYVWDVASPYTGTTQLAQLTLFQNTRNTFNGDLAHLLGLAGGGGRAASLAGLCNSDNDNSMCYSGVNTSYANVPTYSSTVFVVTHEQGHLLGSNHTHACVWNGTNTQIDGCGPTAGYPEGGGCATGPIPPSGGTLMSYCHLNAVGINFLNGFGPQPLAVITNAVANAPCLVACTAVACGPVFVAPTTNISASAAQLNWMPIAGGNSYTLQWKPVGAPGWNTVGPIAGTSHTLTGLSAWTPYTFRVKTNCAADTSAYGALNTFTTAGSSLADGLVACYPFNASPNDQSGNGHHGVLFGPLPTADRHGVPNAAYAFDGVDDRIDVADLSTWAISTEISIGFWVKTLETKGNAVVWAWPDIGTDRLLVSPNFAHTGSNDFSWTFGDLATTGRCYLTGYPFRPEWEHYVVTSSALSNSMKTYRNGVLIDQEQHAGALLNLNRTLCIGGNGAPIFFLHGSLDDLTVHRRELTAGEVMQLYTSGTPCAPQITVAAKVLLEGPYVAANLLMSDALRSANLIPATEPYTAQAYPFVVGGAGTALPAGVLGTTGPNAITDWVVVELRQPTAPHATLATRTALVQRDGDVVGLDGFSAIAFDAAPGSYRIALHHRNHLGVMTGAPFALGPTATTIDLTDPATPTYGTTAQKPVGTRMVLWAGNTADDGVLKYTGANNDRDAILTAIGGIVPTNTLTAVYDPRDVNLDGTVMYTGTGNDRDPILVNIGGTVPTNTREEQLP